MGLSFPKMPNVMPAPQNSNFIGSIPENYDRYLGPVLFEPYAADLVERLRGAKFANVLELACGTGRLTAHLVTLLDEKGRLSATDLNADMIEIAKEKISDQRINWQVADAQELPYADQSFDLVACQFGVMFFPDKAKAFQEACRVLKPGGQFLFNTWDSLDQNTHSLLVQKALREVMGKDAPDFMDRGPFSYFDPEAIRTSLADAGFSAISIRVVAKQAYYQSNETILRGFLEGSPLANFLHKLKPELQQKLKESVAREIVNAFGANNHHFPMQALVCEALKAVGK
jgi:ubiquinone/menaquinone biosynthesis C-methylase UbiE